MSDLGLCIECAKDKQTSMSKYIANHVTDVLERIYTDICGPFPTATRNCHVYFIGFIDDYSRYGYICLIKKMLKFWTHLNPSSLKSSYNSTKELNASNQIVVMNITVALTAK
jgi:hypothetical protein